MDKRKEKKSESKAIMLILAIIIISISLIIWILIYKFSMYKSNINFKIIGKENIVLEVGTEYKEEGYVAKLNNSYINEKVKIISNLNTNILGAYDITYNLKIWYLNIDTKLNRKVYVVDTTKPNLTIDSDKEVTIYAGDKYTYPKCTAIDNYDGDITKSIKIDSNLNTEERGTYEINYSISDSNGNEAKEKIIVHVNKKKNPYIVVSISKQNLSYYEYDKLVLFSNIVTGINNKTPKGTFKILNKTKNVILKGKDYESFVSYWIAFKGNSFGFHDASWRSKFGGDIYKYNGSHGCVNMPYSKVKQLYNMIEIGTPVYIKK